MSRYTDWTSGEPVEKEWDVTDPALRAQQDGPNTHKYHDAGFITSWTLFDLYDPEGERHIFHVPTRIVEQIETVEVAALAAAEAAPLDVKRLATALERCSFSWYEVPLEGPHGVEGVEATFDTERFAADVAREYAALPDTETAGDVT